MRQFDSKRPTQLLRTFQDQSIRIHKNLSNECQMMLFSATYDKDVMNFAENIIPNPVVRIFLYLKWFECFIVTEYYAHRLKINAQKNDRSYEYIIF